MTNDVHSRIARVSDCVASALDLVTVVEPKWANSQHDAETAAQLLAIKVALQNAAVAQVAIASGAEKMLGAFGTFLDEVIAVDRRPTTVARFCDPQFDGVLATKARALKQELGL